MSISWVDSNTLNFFLIKMKIIIEIIMNFNFLKTKKWLLKWKFTKIILSDEMIISVVRRPPLFDIPSF